MPNNAMEKNAPRTTLHGWLSCERRFWIFGSSLLGFIAVAKGIRLPNTWAATQMAVNYDFGFVKRGLIGAALSAVGLSPAVYVNVVLLSIVTFVMAITMLALLVLVSHGYSLLARGAAVGLFFSSFSLTYIAHLAGYTDIFLLAVVLIAILCHRIVLTAFAAVLGTLAHESYVIIFFPLSILPFFLEAMRSDQPLRRLTPILTLVAGVVCLVLFLAAKAPMEQSTTDVLRDALAARADFPLRIDFFVVLGSSAWDNLTVMHQHFRTMDWWRDEFLGALSFFPTALFFLFLSLRVIAGRQGSQGRALVYTGTVSASISPAFMQIFGFDLYRWYALVVLNSFIAAMVVGRHYLVPENIEVNLSEAGRNLVVLLIALNMASGVGLLDDLQVQNFPFADYLDAIIGLSVRH